jgi:peptidoglycan/LPS O-acetylase OafA/YrhL
VQRNSRIAILDGYRALAILLVLFFHYTVRWSFPYDPANHFPPGAIFEGNLIAEYGGFGVEFFFVISGFVILMTLEKCKSILDFAMRRFARLWPSLIVAATLTTIAMLFIGFQEWKVRLPSYLYSIVLINPELIGKLLHEPELNWVDSAYWSLFIEVQFYVVACVCYWLVQKNFIRLWVGLQLIVTMVTIAVSHSHMLTAVADAAIFLPYFPYFTIGVCLYEIHSGGKLGRRAIFGATLAATTIFMSSAFNWNIWKAYDATGGVITNLVIFVFFILFAVRSKIISLFSWRPIAILGQASYSAYLLHQFIGISMMRLLVRHGIGYICALLVTTVGIIVLSVSIFYLVETPAKRLILGSSGLWIKAVQDKIPAIRFDRSNGPALHPADAI